MVNQRLYHSYGSISEINATVKDLKDAEVLIPTTSLFKLPYLSCAENRWILWNDSGVFKINQMVAGIAAAIPDVTSLLQQINISPGT